MITEKQEKNLEDCVILLYIDKKLMMDILCNEVKITNIPHDAKIVEVYYSKTRRGFEVVLQHH